MEKQRVKILSADYVTHNVRRFEVEKPAGLTFVSGQAADISISAPNFEEQLRPFTFTSVNSSDHLEFIIKIYTGHNGVTEKLAELKPGDELFIHDVFGTINFKGPGLFIAAGAGITPFISIFRQLNLENKLTGNTLLFANRTADDIILKDELKGLLGQNYIDVIERSTDASQPPRFIDRELLKPHITHENQYYYICGPDQFISMMMDYLQELGVKKTQIIIEQ